MRLRQTWNGRHCLQTGASQALRSEWDSGGLILGRKDLASGLGGHHPHPCTSGMMWARAPCTNDTTFMARETPRQCEHTLSKEIEGRTCAGANG